jgi:RNA polymerase sporulation-specific sigma factor
MPLQLQGSASACSATADADAGLVQRFWAGDETALDALLDRYRGLVRAKSRSYFLAGADREDVIQEGMIGLYKAIRDFDPCREASFRGFAELCITRQIITAVKSATRQKHTPLNSYVSLYLPACNEDEPDHRLVD